MTLNLPDSYFQELYQTFNDNPELYLWLESIPSHIRNWKMQTKNKTYKNVLKHLEDLKTKDLFTLSSSLEIQRFVKVNFENLEEGYLEYLKHIFTNLKPWRKGPYKVNTLEIDSEWRSDLKWERLLPHLNLKDKLCLDIGTGNGYHLWQMLKAQAKLAIGVEPYTLFFLQFLTIKTLLKDNELAKKVQMIPLGVEQVEGLGVFDYVFSMGVLYHRRDPYEHIQQLYSNLNHGGTLVLESIVIDGDANTALVPFDRYAAMSNVFYIPSIEMIKVWLEKAKFTNIRVVDVGVTTGEEQRVTPWIHDASLDDFLSEDKTKTIEGYPAPQRAIILADKPSLI